LSSLKFSILVPEVLRSNAPAVALEPLPPDIATVGIVVYPEPILVIVKLTTFSDSSIPRTTVLRAGSVVTSVTITNAGTGYTSVPTVAFSGGGATTQATGTVVLGIDESEKVVSFTITNIGSGYTTIPTVAISGGSGSGATAGAFLLRTSGTKIDNFKTDKTSDYIYFSGLKVRTITNATVSQYISGNESTALPPY